MELLIVLAMLQLADTLSTVVALKKGCVEANPVLANLFNRFGVIPTLIISKTVLVAIAYRTMASPLWSEVMIVLCCIYTTVVVNNIRNIVRKWH